jgi:uncharacterized membrane protein
MPTTATSLGSPGVALLLLALAACAADEDWDVLTPGAAGTGAEVTRVSGMVTHLDLEGGLFVIRDDDGTNFNPTNLPGSYRVEGTPVEADVLVRDDVASIAMVGPVVDIVRLRRTGEAPRAEPTSGDADVFTALGQEPGWRLELRPGDRIHLTYAYGEKTLITPVPEPRVEESGARVYDVSMESGSMRVRIEPAACRDAMSGRPFPTTVVVALGTGETLTGCGSALPP